MGRKKVLKSSYASDLPRSEYLVLAKKAFGCLSAAIPCDRRALLKPTIVAALVAISIPSLLELGHRSTTYHAQLIVPHLTRATHEWLMLPFHTDPVRWKDASNAQLSWWARNWTAVVGIVLAFSMLSAVSDLVLSAQKRSVATRQRVRVGFLCVSNVIFMWKLFGLMGLVGPLLAIFSYVWVSAVEHMAQGNRTIQGIGLVMLWMVTIACLVYNEDLVPSFVVRFVERKSFRWMGPMKPLNQPWLSLVKFTMFRTLDYATERLAGTKRKWPQVAVPQSVVYLAYCFYAPLVWQGPVMRGRDFVVQLGRQFAPSGRVSLVKRFKQAFRPLARLLFIIALMQFIHHNWFAGMFHFRGIVHRMRASENVAVMVLQVMNLYLKLEMVWGVASVLAILDGVRPPTAFPKFFLACPSVTEMWKNFNAPVHAWLLENVYSPLARLGGNAVGTVATFVFMIVWHGGSINWVHFGLGNCCIVLFEHLLKQQGLTPLRGGFVDRALWTLKLLMVMFLWFNLFGKISSLGSLSKSKTLFIRTFFNETVEEKLAETWSINNTEWQLDRQVHPAVPIPFPVFVLVGFIVFLNMLRFVIEDSSSSGSSSVQQHLLEHAYSKVPKMEAVSSKEAHAAAKDTYEQFPTLCHVLYQRGTQAHLGAHQPALTWLNGDGRATDELTYRELYIEARTLALYLKENYALQPGDRVVLVYPPGVAFVIAFFACLFGGFVAVPAYPPKPNESHRDKVFLRVLENCQAAIVLSDTRYMTVQRLHELQGSVTKRKMAWFMTTIGGIALMTSALVSFVLPSQLRNTVGVLFVSGLAVGATAVLASYAWYRYSARGAGELVWVRTDNVFAALAPRTWRACCRLAAKVLPAFIGARRDLFEPPLISRSDLAYLQYTSGSTADPKGVKITHANLMHQGFASQTSFACGGLGTTGVNWCPQYHDLGLVVCICSGVFAGIRLVSFSPFDFIKSPMTWLNAISEYQASFSAAPNFAYAYVARKARQLNPVDLAKLDLSSWLIAGNGGEPVRAETLRAFEAQFSRCGFDPESWFPCFGLAEHTILASGRQSRRKPTTLCVDGHDLAQGVVSVGPEGDRELVGCGEAFPQVKIRIIDPSSPGTVVDEGTVGEVWLQSPSVASGYWASDAAFSHDFGEEGRFLPTGDLGFLWGGELFICGRLKDLIIIDGRNIYPQDLERLAEEALPGLLRPGSSAAFLSSRHELIVVAEVAREAALDEETLSRACRVVYTCIMEKERLAVSTVVLVPAGALEKTSSGKVRRRAISALYASHALKGVLCECSGDALLAPATATQQPLILPQDLLVDLIEAILEATGEDGIPLELQDADITAKAALGLSELLARDGGALSSLDAVQFANALTDALEVRGFFCAVEPHFALRYPTVRHLAHELATRVAR